MQRCAIFLSCCGNGNKLVVAWAFPRDHIGVVGTRAQATTNTCGIAGFRTHSLHHQQTSQVKWLQLIGLQIAISPLLCCLDLTKLQTNGSQGRIGGVLNQNYHIGQDIAVSSNSFATVFFRKSTSQDRRKAYEKPVSIVGCRHKWLLER